MNVCQTSAQSRRSVLGCEFGRPGVEKFSRWLPLAWWTGFVFLLAICCAPLHAEKVEQLTDQGYVNDFAGVIDAGSKQQLTQLCQELDTKADAQIAVVTIHTLEGDTAEDFANRLFAKWGVGPKGKDRGVLILLAVDDHKYWTEVGYGLQPILPDGKVGGFGRQMLPILRQNQYGAALLQMTGQVAAVIAQDHSVTLSQSPPAARPEPDENSGGPTIFGLPPQIFFFLVVFLFIFGWRVLALILGLLGFGGGMSGGGGAGGGW
jgi:uncharacterized protein